MSRGRRLSCAILKAVQRSHLNYWAAADGHMPMANAHMAQLTQGPLGPCLVLTALIQGPHCQVCTQQVRHCPFLVLVAQT